MVVVVEDLVGTGGSALLKQMRAVLFNKRGRLLGLLRHAGEAALQLLPFEVSPLLKDSHPMTTSGASRSPVAWVAPSFLICPQASYQCASMPRLINVFIYGGVLSGSCHHYHNQ